jgi:uncharacterized glyoxalase superfamily protein PhnB
MVERSKLLALVPLLPVRGVPRSIEFYGKLGFSVLGTHTPEGGPEPVWAELKAGGAHLMISRTHEASEVTKQPVLFYLYTPDVAAFRGELLEKGVQAGVVEYPFWAPRGEFRVEDPDGYVLMVTHT